MAYDLNLNYITYEITFNINMVYLNIYEKNREAHEKNEFKYSKVRSGSFRCGSFQPT